MWYLKRNVARAGVVLALVVGVNGCGGSSPSTAPSSPESASPKPATDPPSVELGGAAWSTVYGFGGAWIQVDPPVDQVVKVDASSGRIPVTIDGGRGAAIAEDAVWVVDGRKTRKLDPDTGEVLLTASTPGADYVAVGEGAVWVSAAGGIARLDPSSGVVAATIAIDAEEVTDLAAAEDGVSGSPKRSAEAFCSR